MRLEIYKPLPPLKDFLFPRFEAIHQVGILSNNGPQVQELEARLADWLSLERSQVVATASGTVGLQVACWVANCKIWRVPGWTFPATVGAPLSLGHSVSLVDVSGTDWIGVFDGRPADTGDIKVIPFGATFDSSVWEPKREVIIDAAASLASRPPGVRSIPESGAVIFSLHVTKSMGGVEGGIVAFGSPERAALARSWINFGFAGSRQSVVPGINGKLSEYHAAYVNARLDGWGEELPKWQKTREMARQVASDLAIDGVPTAMNTVNPYWIALFSSAEDRDAAMRRLQRSDITYRLWWESGLKKMPAFESLSLDSSAGIDSISSRYLGLPFHSQMQEPDFLRIHEALRA